MAEKQRGGQSQQSQQSQGAGMQAAGAAGAQGREQRADQERTRQVSRERAPAGTGMQRAGARQGGGGMSLARQGQQSSLLPSFMSNPALMASAMMSNPFAFAQAMSQEMDRLFSSFDVGEQGGRGLTAGGGRQGMQQGIGQGGLGLAQWVPPIEVFQRGNDLVVRADLAGVNPDDVTIEIENGALTIAGERRQEADDQQEGFYRSERSYGAFARTIALPEGIDEDRVDARFQNGVLEITAPLPQQQQRARRVQIQSGAGATTSGQQQTGRHGGRQAADQSATQSGAESGRSATT